MRKEEINDRKQELVNSANDVIKTLECDLRDIHADDSLSDICSQVSYYIEKINNLKEELEAELNDLEMLRDAKIE